MSTTVAEQVAERARIEPGFAEVLEAVLKAPITPQGTLERVAARHAGHMKVVKVNIDETPELAARYGAMSIPLLVLIDRGQEVARQVGAVPEPRLAAWVEPWLATV